MYPVSRYWFLLVAVILGACCLWKTGSFSWPVSSVHAKASIQLDLSLPSRSLLPTHRFFNRTVRTIDEKNRRRYRGPISRYMLQLYQRRPDADIVKALEPNHISGPVADGGRILEFSIPYVDRETTLEAAELLGTVGTIMRVRLMDDNLASEKGAVQRSRRDDVWRAFNVTSAVVAGNGKTVRLHVNGNLGYRLHGDGPILLLSYSKPKKKRRHRRSIPEPDDPEDNEGSQWEDSPRKRRRNSCRRRPLYVDFALISYDEWVVAPPGYEAYQCAGKCFYPFGDHLSPTKHAIVQTLVHGALQSGDALNGNKPVGRACCVPTRLAPTSLLYLDAAGTLTYQYGYEDMVVAECGCR